MKLSRAAIFLLIILAIAAGAYALLRPARAAWQAPVVVTIETSQKVGSLYPSWWATWTVDPTADPPRALLLRPGDLLVSEGLSFEYRSSDGQTLKLTANDWSIQLGETIVAVDPGKTEGLDWVGKASDRQLADLRTVDVPMQIDDATLGALQRIAAVNPGVHLIVEDEEGLERALPLFRPRAVIADGVSAPRVLRMLSSHPQIETLTIEPSEPGSLDFLPALPNLRRLILVRWDVGQAGPLPAGIAPLKALMIVESDDLANLSPLNAAPAGLEELSLIDLEKLRDLSGVERFKGLRTIVAGPNANLADVRALAALPQLRWASLPPGMTQEQFSTFIAAHPQLEVLDLLSRAVTTDLEPLRGLSSLRALLLGGPVEHLDALHGLESLRYIGVTEKAAEASPDQIAAIRKALPEALVLRVTPYCLGSGWILLLMPVFFVRRIRQRQSWTLGRAS